MPVISDAPTKVKPPAAGKAVADAIAIAHFLVANIIAIAGDFTDLFVFMKVPHGGIHFVMQYLDGPIYMAFGPMFWDSGDVLNLWLSAEGVILLSSFLYWVTCYLAVRAYFALLQG